ncbi:MAG TPA: alpha/beta hydrolase [Myxococcota bacterium]|nr:alpha/beta hydrolase [Myxococcota bacterium]
MLRPITIGLTRALSRVVTPLERDGLCLDPELHVLCAAQEWMPRLHDIDPELSRARYRRSSRLGGPARVELHSVEDQGRLRIYRPGPAASRGLLYFHGGGFVIGSIDTHDSICRRLASDSGRVVISGEYRLAPEHPFPAAIEDVEAMWRQCQDLGLDSLAVGGDSAGGNLAAVLSQRVEGIERQLLIYPGTDFVGPYPSKALFAEGLMLTEQLKRWFTFTYAQGADMKDPRMSAINGQLGGLPPAHVIVAGFDPLRDEGIAYAEAMRAAGGEVELVRFDSLVHGFLNIAGLSRASDSALTAIASLIAVDSDHG